MLCNKCQSQAEHKVFSTFDYWYCGACRSEVALEPPISNSYKAFVDGLETVFTSKNITFAPGSLIAKRTGYQPPAAPQQLKLQIGDVVRCRQYGWELEIISAGSQPDEWTFWQINSPGIHYSGTRVFMNHEYVVVAHKPPATGYPVVGPARILKAVYQDADDDSCPDCTDPDCTGDCTP